MSLLDEQRTQIVEENTGQADFLDILENLSPTTTDIILQKSLSGDIDGEVLEKMRLYRYHIYCLRPWKQ
jgi:hypothetical protein